MNNTESSYLYIQRGTFLDQVQGNIEGYDITRTVRFFKSLEPSEDHPQEHEFTSELIATVNTVLEIPDVPDEVIQPYRQILKDYVKRNIPTLEGRGIQTAAVGAEMVTCMSHLGNDGYHIAMTE